jgi:hypothetical protein
LKYQRTNTVSTFSEYCVFFLFSIFQGPIVNLLSVSIEYHDPALLCSGKSLFDQGEMYS